MTSTLATLIVLFAPATIMAVIAIKLWRRIAAFGSETYPVEWALELSADRYRPMFRLLAEDDLRFLRSQPGGTQLLVNGLRRQRARIFEGYLRRLECDFQIAFRALFYLMAQAPTDRRDMARALIMSRLNFSTSIFVVRCRLLLYRWNVGAAPVANLVRLFEQLHLDLTALAPPPECSVS